MLQGSPWLLAHRSMLKPNQPMKVSLYGQEYVMWQDSSGEVHGLPNACPHMGAMLSEGWCVAKSDGSSTIACPFHALEFDQTGSTVLPSSNKLTKSLIKPLELIIQGDFIWSYGGLEPKIPIPTVLNEFAAEYEFAGVAGHRSIKTDLLTMPKVIEAHLENYFPVLIIFHGESPLGTIKQCHIFVPESETDTRTYVLVFGKFKNPVFRSMKNNILKLVETVVEQDADILSKLYPNTPQHIKLNNEVGMDWVRRNFESFPEIVEPNLTQ